MVRFVAIEMLKDDGNYVFVLCETGRLWWRKQVWRKAFRSSDSFDVWRWLDTGEHIPGQVLYDFMLAYKAQQFHRL